MTTLMHPNFRERCRQLDPKDQELTEADLTSYRHIISTGLSAEQQARMVLAPRSYPGQEAILAVHWHPEFVPMELILARVHATFPNRKYELLIPTQHNTLLTLNGFAGVEIDCHSREFNRKAQLLAHFRASRVAGADRFRAMLAHTFTYRSSQLFEFLDALIEPASEDRLRRAAASTGADDELIEFVRTFARKLRQLLRQNQAVTPPEAIKNKLMAYFLDGLRDRYDDRLINHAQSLVKAVKESVKASFALSHFYGTREVIEEIRGLGGGVVIPHPEQFWPILLADYDVDGIEVWNPQSREYTQFLIDVVGRKNRTKITGSRSLLVFMGDDTHMGEKARDPKLQDPEKAGREIGVQPAWDDPAIRKSLIGAHADRLQVIREYQERLT